MKGMRWAMPNARSASGRIWMTMMPAKKATNSATATNCARGSGKAISPMLARISIAMPSMMRSATMIGAVTLIGVPVMFLTMYALSSSPTLPGVITIKLPTPKTRALSQREICTFTSPSHQCQRSMRTT
jgi:hypothetical protein